MAHGHRFGTWTCESWFWPGVDQLTPLVALKAMIHPSSTGPMRKELPPTNQKRTAEEKKQTKWPPPSRLRGSGSPSPPWPAAKSGYWSPPPQCPAAARRPPSLPELGSALQLVWSRRFLVRRDKPHPPSKIQKPTQGCCLKKTNTKKKGASVNGSPM